LEAPLKSSIFLDVLSVFGQRGGTDAPQFTASKHGLQEIGCIHGTFAFASTEDQVNFVNKQYYLSLGLLDLRQDSLQPFFELTSILSSCYKLG
jgi:hypothetical protein